MPAIMCDDSALPLPAVFKKYMLKNLCTPGEKKKRLSQFKHLRQVSPPCN